MLFSSRNLDPASVSISPHKLDPLRELQLLRKQQEQLQQLQQLENRLKQTSSASSATSKSESSSVVSTSKPESATDSSWSQNSHGNQSMTVQERNKTNATDQNTGYLIFVSFVTVKLVRGKVFTKKMEDIRIQCTSTIQDLF